MSAQLQPLPTSRNLGWMLQSVRKSKGLTQAHLASRVGVGQSRISHLEQHPEELSVQQLLAWCSALNLELSIGPKGASDTGAPATGGSKPAW
jgi:HTH-type transcriptional regulator/antitoxin HipB